jgi:diguanylate cyclase (GGDEF)-like protein
MLIRKKLPLIMILLVLVPMLVLFTIYYIYISGELTQKNKEEMDKVLNINKEYLDAFFANRLMEVQYLSERNDVKHILEAYQKNPDIENKEIQELHRALSDKFETIESNSNVIDVVFVLSFDGILIASGDPNSYWIDLSEREYFQTAMEGKVVISNLLTDKVYGRSVIFVAAPVYDEEQQNVVGVIVNLIDMKETSKIFSEIVEPGVGEAYIVNESGDIVFHQNSELIGKSPENQYISEFMSSNEFQLAQGKMEIRNGFENTYITFTSLNQTNWKIVLEQDMNRILEPAYQALNVMLIVLISAFIIVGMISLEISKRLIKPLTELTQIATRTKKGDLNLRFSYDKKNEYGQLAESFNSMLDELHATEEELRVNNEDLMESKQELEEVQIKYNQALESAKDIVWEWKIDTNELFVSEHWNIMFSGQPILKRVKRVPFEQLLKEKSMEEFEQCLKKLIMKEEKNIIFEFPFHNQKDELFWYEIKASIMLDEQLDVIKISGTLSDHTINKQHEERIWNLAYIDSLTCLPNRLSFRTDLTTLIQEIIDEEKDQELALFLMDMDNFKTVNDTFGHSVGDELLIEVSNRFKKNQWNAYHLSGDEFAIILQCYDKFTELAAFSKKIHNLFQEPFIYNGKTLIISFSIGVSVYPADGNNSDKLIQNADTALYIAKEEGKSTTVIFTQFMEEKLLRKMEIETILRKAMKELSLSMYYQPQYSPSESKLESFEALMRLFLADGTSISPCEFIPVAEETGLIVPMGEWAFRNVLRQLIEWEKKGIPIETVSINVSGVQLRKEDFANRFIEIVHEEGVNPGKIELEITESTLMDSTKKNIQMLQQLKTAGFRIALDDFGTGYSSFQYLQTLPITTLKIDKTFIDNITQNKKTESIVRQIIEIGHEMDLIVVAEGVESKEQKDILNSLSCDLIQGYFYSKPLSVMQTETLLNHI